jgi:hypothetical protein
VLQKYSTNSSNHIIGLENCLEKGEALYFGESASTPISCQVMKSHTGVQLIFTLHSDCVDVMEEDGKNASAPFNGTMMEAEKQSLGIFLTNLENRGEGGSPSAMTFLVHC